MENNKITSFFKKAIKKLGKKKIALIVLAASVSVNSVVLSIGSNGFDKKNETSVADLAKKLNEKTDISDLDILSLDYDTRNLDFTYARFLSDISNLPEQCPFLEYLNLNYCSSLTDLSALYRMPNLKEVRLKAVACVNEELVNYLNANNIKHNITADDLLVAKKLDIIVDNLIDDDMGDEEKINRIVSYIIKNYKYDRDLIVESYYDPLVGMVNMKKGVCSRFSYLTNVLLRKVGVESFEVRSIEHTWNLVELYDRYYYIDSTNITMDVPSFISIPLLENANIGIHYLTNPGINFLEHSENYYDSSLVSIPDDLVVDIKAGWDKASLYEKYGRTVPIRLIEALCIILVLSKSTYLVLKTQKKGNCNNN